MKAVSKTLRVSGCVVAMAVVAVGGTAMLQGAPAEDEGDKAAAKPTPRLARAVAKDRAEVLHHVYLATLEAMHLHYFRANKAVLPARAMEDVFADVAEATNSSAKWISVNTKAMSVDHTPETEFEKSAAAELARGTPEFTVFENGFYRRATSIPLGAGCVSCHTGNNFGPPPKTPRFAGLIISLPVEPE